ncbi:unnamed protein product [Parnassius mnemosyne]|uniref:Uncharacterized protein n=1 Tax=Parnassius mnemosyne TaxID=213953 RepID=A0AAV1MCG3_9NEOP
MSQNIGIDDADMKQSVCGVFYARLTKVLNSLLSGVNKTHAYNGWIMPVLMYTFGILRHPPVFNLDKGENLGSLYTFKGSKVLNTVSNAPSNKLKLQYEVIVRVVDDGSENNEKTAKKDEVKAPIIILKPSSDIKVDSSKNSEVKKTFSKIVKSLIIDDVLPTVSGVLPLTPDDVKLTIDDVQLLQTEKVSPTTTLLNNVEDISTTTYTPSLNNDEFMPIISSQSNLGDYMTDYDDITTEDLLQPLTENVANVSVGDIQTSTEAGQS